VGQLVSRCFIILLSNFLSCVVISGFIRLVCLQATYFFAVPAGWIISVRIRSSFDYVFELGFVFRSLVTSDGSLDDELFNPWDSLTVIVLEKAFSDHSVTSIAIGGHLKNDIYPGKGSIFPGLVEIFTVAMGRNSETEHAAEAVSIPLAHIEGRVRANEEASDHLEPAVGVIGEG